MPSYRDWYWLPSIVVARLWLQNCHIAASQFWRHTIVKSSDSTFSYTAGGGRVGALAPAAGAAGPPDLAGPGNLSMAALAPELKLAEGGGRAFCSAAGEDACTYSKIRQNELNFLLMYLSREPSITRSSQVARQICFATQAECVQGTNS